MKCCTWQPVADAFNRENTFKWTSFSSLVPFRFLWSWNSRGEGAGRLFLATGVSSPCYLLHTHTVVSMMSLFELLWAGEPPARWLVSIILYSGWQPCVLADLLHRFHTFHLPLSGPPALRSTSPPSIPGSLGTAFQRDTHPGTPSIPRSPSHCWWPSRHVDPHTQSFCFLSSSPPGLCSHLLEPHHGYGQRLCPWAPIPALHPPSPICLAPAPGLHVSSSACPPCFFSPLTWLLCTACPLLYHLRLGQAQPFTCWAPMCAHQPWPLLTEGTGSSASRPGVELPRDPTHTHVSPDWKPSPSHSPGSLAVAPWEGEASTLTPSWLRPPALGTKTCPLFLSRHACTFSHFSHVWLCNPMDCSQPGSSVYGILQARILEWVAISFSKGFSRPRNWTHISGIAGWFFTTKPPGKPSFQDIALEILPCCFPFISVPFP